MEVVSKYWGKCSTCNGKIEKGTLIDWTKEHKARHTACAGSAPATPRPQAPAAPARPYSKQQQTGQVRQFQRPAPPRPGFVARAAGSPVRQAPATMSISYTMGCIAARR